MPTQKKLGRPTDSPKVTQISVRFDNETLKILDEYCQQEHLTRVQAIRVAVFRLKKEK